MTNEQLKQKQIEQMWEQHERMEMLNTPISGNTEYLTQTQKITGWKQDVHHIVTPAH